MKHAWAHENDFLKCPWLGAFDMLEQAAIKQTIVPVRARPRRCSVRRVLHSELVWCDPL
jgi:hypothetical protein